MNNQNELKNLLEETKTIIKETKDLEKESNENKKKIQQQREKISILAIETAVSSLLDTSPIFYNESKMLWKWNTENFFWEIADEAYILNLLRQLKLCDINSVSTRARWLNAIKQEGRRRVPKNLDNYEIQLKNKILNIKTDQWRNATPKEFCVNPLPYKLGDPKKCEKFDKLFNSWVKPEYVVNLYEIMAFCLLPLYFIERMFVLLGTGANGKGVFKVILANLLGGDKNITTSDLNMLSTQRFASSSLYKKLLCEIGETNVTKLKETQLLKRLCSGKDNVRAEFKGKDQFNFINYAKILISTNYLPETEDKTFGFYRKWLIIDFPNVFEIEKDMIKDLTTEDYENLMAKCLETLKSLLTSLKFSNEGNFEERKARYEEKANPLDKFISEQFEIGEEINMIAKWEVRQTINMYLKSIGRMEKSDKEIQDILIKLGCGESSRTINNKFQRTFTNISWKNLKFADFEKPKSSFNI